jgi:ethanolamine utilization protein EutA
MVTATVVAITNELGSRRETAMAEAGRPTAIEDRWRVDAAAGELTGEFVATGDDIQMTTVGIDIGSATSHVLISRIHLRRLGKRMSSRYVAVHREVLHRSRILLTPYRSPTEIDADAVSDFIREAFATAGVTPDSVDTGAVILTGEALRRRNSAALAGILAGHSGKFVCVTAGHGFECVMAAHGSGSVEFSREEQTSVLNIDMGGGTTKLTVCRSGVITATAAINVGTRLVAADQDGIIVRIEPAAHLVAESLGVPLGLGQPLTPALKDSLANALTDCVLSALDPAGMTDLTRSLMLTPAIGPLEGVGRTVFSAGISEYLSGQSTMDFGDLGQALASTLRRRIDTGRFPGDISIPEGGIRATVLGMSQYTVQVSGDTITVTHPDGLPLRNVQVLYPALPDLSPDVDVEEISGAIRESIRRFDIDPAAQPIALALDWDAAPAYPTMRRLAEGVKRGLEGAIAVGHPVILVFESDIGRAIGLILKEDLDVTTPVISIDCLELKELDFIDVGAVLHPSKAVPVIVKSLVFPDAAALQAEGRPLD